MKKTNLVCVIGIGLLTFLPFIGVAVAEPPCWVGIQVGDTYIWEYDMDWTARDGAWTTDGVSLLIFANMNSAWMGWVNDDEMAYLHPGNMSHEVTVVDDLASDVEYSTGYMSVLYTSAVRYASAAWTGDWADKDTGINLWNGIILEEESDFVDYHNGLADFFSIYGFSYQTKSLIASTDLDWGEVATLANANLTDATVTVVTDSASEEIGFKITVAAAAWTTNTLALELEVTYDEAGLLDVWDIAYGGDSVLTVTQLAGRTGYTPCPPAAPAIPGFELPIVIGITAVSIISLILIKKIKNR